MILHQHTSLNFGVGYDVGRKQEGKPNADSFGSYADRTILEYDITQKGLLYIVADGMGDAAVGAIASKMAVEHTLAYYYQDVGTKLLYCLERAIQNANTQIYQLGHSDLSYHGMGSTIVAALFDGNMLHIGHVGNSRAYLLRDGELLQLTKDHSLVQEQVRAGLLTPEEAATHPQRNVLSRNLGSERQAQPDLVSHRVYLSDVVLLCSDGLWGEVSDQEIATVLHQYNPAMAAQKLVDLANEHGGSDNISLIVRRVDWFTESAAKTLPLPKAPAPRPRQLVSGLFHWLDASCLTARREKRNRRWREALTSSRKVPRLRRLQAQARGAMPSKWAIAATEAQMPLAA